MVRQRRHGSHLGPPTLIHTEGTGSSETEFEYDLPCEGEGCHEEHPSGQEDDRDPRRHGPVDRRGCLQLEGLDFMSCGHRSGSTDPASHPVSDAECLLDCLGRFVVHGSDLPDPGPVRSCSRFPLVRPPFRVLHDSPETPYPGAPPPVLGFGSDPMSHLHGPCAGVTSCGWTKS